jgi:hypothetical protein
VSDVGAAREPLGADEAARRVIEVALAKVTRQNEHRVGRPNAWRFSGRWWASPLPLRRDRPSR